MAHTKTVGLGLAGVSAATFGTSGSFADSLLETGWTPGAAVTYRIVLAALVLAVPALIQLRGRWSLLRRSLPAVAVYGLIAIAGCQYFFFNAVEHLSVGVALLLEYSGTLLVVLWMWLRHGQRPTRLTAAGGLVAIVGLVLVLDLTGPSASASRFAMISRGSGPPPRHVPGAVPQQRGRPGRDRPSASNTAAMRTGRCSRLTMCPRPPRTAKGLLRC